MMQSKNFPFVFCHLTDQNGKIINPCQPGAIVFTEMSCLKHRTTITTQSSTGETVTKQLITVAIKGFVAVCSDAGILSMPIPFCIIKYLFLYAPNGTDLRFALNCFRCSAVPIFSGEDCQADCIKIAIHIDATVHATAKACLLVPTLDDCNTVCGKMCISVDRIYDSVRFRCKTCILHTNLLRRAEIYQYNAISNAHQRIYTNADELTAYGHHGLLPPDEVSYCNVFVNGVLQPKINYDLIKGRLTLKTTDLPLQGQAVMVTYVTFINLNNEIQPVTSLLYSAVSDGEKRIFTNADALTEYDSTPIPSPHHVSYFNLYVNGVLQPDTNYTVEKGVLKLNTEDLPLRGQIITLESLIIKTPCGGVFRVKNYQYNAYSKATKIFTDKDGIREYGGAQIISPKFSTYQNLFVNCVIQPSISYSVEEGCLRLNTTDAPIKGAPVSLQYVNEHSEFPSRECLASDLAIIKWHKQYAVEET